MQSISFSFAGQETTANIETSPWVGVKIFVSEVEACRF